MLALIGHELENDRARRRDRDCVAAGSLTGAGLCALAGVFVPLGGAGLAVVGALAGGALGRILAFHLSPDDWDPPAERRPYVGASAPDDDIASAT